VRAIGLTFRTGWRPTTAQQRLLRAIRDVAQRVGPSSRQSLAAASMPWRAAT